MKIPLLIKGRLEVYTSVLRRFEGHCNNCHSNDRPWNACHWNENHCNTVETSWDYTDEKRWEEVRRGEMRWKELRWRKIRVEMRKEDGKRWAEKSWYDLKRRDKRWENSRWELMKRVEISWGEETKHADELKKIRGGINMCENTRWDCMRLDVGGQKIVLATHGALAHILWAHFVFFALWAFIFEASAPGLPGHYFWRLHPTRIHSPTAASGELETAQLLTAQLLTEKARAQLQGVRQELSAECAAAKAGE